MISYFDLDGVLNNLEDWLLDLNPKAFKNPFEMTTTLLQNYKKAFLTSIPYKEGLDLYFKKRDENSRILTSLPKIYFERYYPYLWESYKECGRMLDVDYIFGIFSENKKKWCVKNLQIPENRVIIVESHMDKLEWCREGDVLYDDNPYTIEGWKKKGGIGMLTHFGRTGWKWK